MKTCVTTWVRRLVACIVLGGLSTLAPATSPVLADELEASDLVGTWRVDLRPTPDADPYFQPFVVRAAGPDGLEGTFYGTEITDGSLNTDWGAVHFAFVTGDGSGAYHTSGKLEDGVISGRTHALGRDFLAVWTATREGAAGATPAAGTGLHPAAPAETSQFGFLLGEHRCTTRQLRPDGTYVDTGEADWNGRYILGGWAIEDEWISQLPDGSTFRGVNIRSFNSESGQWDNRWLQSGNLQWKYYSAEAVGETMVMVGGEGEDQLGAFVDRNVFSETGATGFKWRKDRSWDGGETWVQGVATIDCRTVE